MADKIFITQAQLDAIAAGLSKLKKKTDERLPLKKAVARISPVISETLSKGYSYSEIAEMLRRDYKIEIKDMTLSSYHRSAAKSSKPAAPNDLQSGSSEKTSRDADAAAAEESVLKDDDTTDHSDSKFIKDPDL